MHYHTGLAYETTGEFLAGALPFVSSGVSEDHAVIAIVGEEKAAALREAGGDVARAVEFHSGADWYMSQARAFSKFIQRARSLQQEGRRGLCILTDPSAAGFDDEQVRRWVYTENAVNQVLREMPLAVMCTYDLQTAGLSLDQIEASHPHMAADGNVCSSAGFVEPLRFNQSPYAVSCNDVPANVHAMAFDMRSLHELRVFVDATAAKLGLSSSKIVDLVIASSEAAGNAVEHGGGSGLASVWRDGAEVICEIQNASGHIPAGAAGFVTPGWAAERGRGIWMMRQLCEWVDLRTNAPGTTVRLHMRD